MEDNNRCIILTHKEYEELKAKAEQAKPDEVNIQLSYDIRYRQAAISTYGTIDLSNNLQRQIRRIADMVGENNRQKVTDAINEGRKSWQDIGYNEAMAEFASMSWFERLAFEGKARTRVYISCEE